MATSKIQVSEGSGKNLATYSFSEDAVTKEAQRISIVDSSGNPISTETILSENYLKSAIINDIQLSSANSSTGNLSAGASFNGTSVSNAGAATVQVHLYTDQNCTIVIYQSTDGTNWDFTDTYKTTANAADARQVQCKGLYVKVSVTNNGASSTTFFRFQTLLVPIGEPLGNFNAVLVDIHEKASYTASSTAIFAAVAGTNLFFNMQGSSTKTIRIKKVRFSGFTGTLGVARIQLAKYSTAPSGGSATALTQVPHDSFSPAATASAINTYATTAATAGTKVGDLGSRTALVKSGTVVDGANWLDVEFLFGEIQEIENVVLRGTAQGIGAYFSVAPAAAVNMVAEVVWTEE